MGDKNNHSTMVHASGLTDVGSNLMAGLVPSPDDLTMATDGSSHGPQPQPQRARSPLNKRSQQGNDEVEATHLFQNSMTNSSVMPTGSAGYNPHSAGAADSAVTINIVPWSQPGSPIGRAALASGAGSGHSIGSPTMGMGMGMGGPSNGLVAGSKLERDGRFPSDGSISLAGGTGNGMDMNMSGGQMPAGIPAGMPTGMPGFDENMMMTLTQSIGRMIASISMDQATPQDMIQMGMGMGMAILGTNMGNSLAPLTAPPGAGTGTGATGAGRAHSSLNHSGMFTQGGMGAQSPHFNVDQRQYMASRQMGQTANTFPELYDEDFSKDGRANQNVLAVDPSASRTHPIGIPDFRDPQESNKTTLNHSEEKRQISNSYDRLGQPLTAMQNALELTKVLPTETPDEVIEKVLTNELPANADVAVREELPLLIYPELSTQTIGGAPKESVEHPAAGVGTSYLLEKEHEQQLFIPESASKLRRTVMPLPKGFFESIVGKHIAKQAVDYLPQVPNLPQARTVGRVKPRSAAADWIAINFDPWSAGKVPLNFEFINSLSSKAEGLFAGGSAAAAEALENLRSGSNTQDAFLSVEDRAGQVEQRKEVSKAEVMARDFAKLTSLARHGKFSDVEDMLNQPDWNVPIDYSDERGNTLLHIAAQNGSRRIAKLCIRRGAVLNAQNLNGQTCLHFAFGYGFNDLGEYLVSKGCNDAILNKDKLTCYEGLDGRELSLL